MLPINLPAIAIIEATLPEVTFTLIIRVMVAFTAFVVFMVMASSLLKASYLEQMSNELVAIKGTIVIDDKMQQDH
jgi:hypothetical protein